MITYVNENGSAGLMARAYAIKEEKPNESGARDLLLNIEPLLSQSVKVTSNSPFKPDLPSTLIPILDNSYLYIKVRKGDSLKSISKRSGVSLDQLRSLNNLKRPFKLTSGMHLKIARKG